MMHLYNRGNTPAGYFITNTEDLGKWIKIQLGTVQTDSIDRNLINTSHIPGLSVSPNSDDHSSYAAGKVNLETICKQVVKNIETSVSSVI